jgi:hypothetical protein
LSAGAGRYLKTSKHLLLGWVRLEYTAGGGEPLVVTEAPGVLGGMRAQHGHDDLAADAPGFVAWRRGTVAGVRLGARLAELASGSIEIQDIRGTYVDSNERSMAGAAALALWDALGLVPSPELRGRLDEIILDEAAPLE